MQEQTLAEWNDNYADYGGALPQLRAALEARLAEDPELEADAAEVVARRLASPIGPETVDWIRGGFDDLGLAHADALLAWVARRGAPVLAELEQDGASPRLTRLLRRVVARHGPDLHRAVLVMNASPEDWRQFRREIAYDVDADRYSVTIEIERFDGTTFSIRGDQNSLLILARNVITALGAIKPPDAFLEVERAGFLEELRAISAHLEATTPGR